MSFVKDFAARRPSLVEKKERLIVYSNRPPSAGRAGGVSELLHDFAPSAWVGPIFVSDAHWEQLVRQGQQHTLTPKDHGTFVEYNFPVPQKYIEPYYNNLINGIFYKVFTSLDPQIYLNPEAYLAQNAATGSCDFHFSAQRLEDSYRHFLEFNALANHAFEQLKDRGVIGPDDVLWTHDVHAASVKGDAITLHTSFPSLEYVQKVTLDGTALLHTHFFRDYFSQIVANHSVVSCLGARHMQNFIRILGELDPEFYTRNHRALARLHPETPHEMEKHIPLGADSALRLTFEGKSFTLLNQMFGRNTEDIVARAKQGQQNIACGFMQTTLSQQALQKTGILTDENMTNAYDLLSPALADGHQMFLSVHRNDLVKGTLESLAAIDQFFTTHTEEIGRTHFVLFLSPSSSEAAPDNAHYYEYLYDYAAQLHKKYGASVMTIAAGIDNTDYLGLIRHPNTIAFMAPAPTDAHPLTLREAIEATSDQPGDTTALILSEAIGGASELYSSTTRPGAFIVNGHPDIASHIHGLSDAFATVTKLHRSTEGRQELAQRHAFLVEQDGLLSQPDNVRMITNAVRREKRAAVTHEETLSL